MSHRDIICSLLHDVRTGERLGMYQVQWANTEDPCHWPSAWPCVSARDVLHYVWGSVECQRWESRQHAFSCHPLGCSRNHGHGCGPCASHRAMLVYGHGAPAAQVLLKAREGCHCCQHDGGEQPIWQCGQHCVLDVQRAWPIDHRSLHPRPDCDVRWVMDEEGPQFTLMASAMWSMWRQDWFWTWQCFLCPANTAKSQCRGNRVKFNRWAHLNKGRKKGLARNTSTCGWSYPKWYHMARGQPHSSLAISLVELKRGVLQRDVLGTVIEGWYWHNQQQRLQTCDMWGICPTQAAALGHPWGCLQCPEIPIQIYFGLIKKD